MQIYEPLRVYFSYTVNGLKYYNGPEYLDNIDRLNEAGWDDEISLCEYDEPMGFMKI